jgi:hypothetical protein
MTSTMTVGAVEINGDDLLRSPVGEPDAAVVPTRLLSRDDAGDDYVWRLHTHQAEVEGAEDRGRRLTERTRLDGSRGLTVSERSSGTYT